MYKQNPQKKKLWISLLFISCVWFIFYDLKTLFSDHLYVITNDTLQYFWTEITFTVNSIKEFRIPLWNPFIEFGEPHISRSFTVFFSPITILLSNILSARAIYILNSTLPVFVGSLGVLILTKNIYSLSASASLISAISFLNCGINQAQSYHLSFVFGFSFLPWIFYSIESLLVHKVYKGHVLLTIMFSIVFLCANPQYIFYNIIASILYFIVRIYTNNKYNQGSERNVNDRKAKRIWFTDLQPAQKVIHIRLPLKGLLYFGTFFILMGVILNEGYLAFLFSKDGIIQSKIYLVYIRGYQVFTIGLGTVLIIKFIKKSFDNKYNLVFL